VLKGVSAEAYNNFTTTKFNIFNFFSDPTLLLLKKIAIVAAVLFLYSCDKDFNPLAMVDWR
jgi:hypothetical protein